MATKKRGAGSAQRPLERCVRPNCESVRFIPGEVTVVVPRGSGKGEVDGQFVFCVACATPQIATAAGMEPTIIGHQAGIALRSAQQQRFTNGSLEGAVAPPQRPSGAVRARTPLPAARVGARRVAES